MSKKLRVFHGDIMSGVTANTLSRTINVTDYEVIMVGVYATGSPEFNIKAKGATHETGELNAPADFADGSQTLTNEWVYLQVVNSSDGLKTESSAAGGIALDGVAADHFVIYEYNVNHIDSVAIDLTDYVAGTTNVTLRATQLS